MEAKDQEFQNIIIKKTCVKVLVLLFINTTVWLLGAFTFLQVEGSNEGAHKCGVKRVKRDFLDTLWDQTGKLEEQEWKSLARRRLETFEEEIHVAVEAGVSSVTSHDVWTPSNAIMYTFTLASTIGYGSLTPTSPWVRILSMLYAGVACPLCCCLLSNISSLLSILLMKKDSCGVNPSLSRILFLMGVYTAVGSISFSLLYNWSPNDSFYFLASTFTTIGFGDILPEDAFTFLLSGIYLLIGLSLFSIYQDVVMEKYSVALENLLRIFAPKQKMHKE